MEEVFTNNWQEFVLACLAIVAFATALKSTIRVWWKEFPKGEKGKAVMSWMNIFLGVLVGLPEYLPGSLTNRIILGLVAGLFSVFVYNGVTKRLKGVLGNNSAQKSEEPSA